MATQTMQAMGPTMEGVMARKPLPSLPSPTLTNPDMVLPNERRAYAPVNSPPRHGRRDRPPSPSYLRNTTDETIRLRTSSSVGNMTTPKKEKRGLMSRKMMLLRSRTTSSGMQVTTAQPAHDEFENFDSAYGSSPTLMDVGNLAPEQDDVRRGSVGSSSIDSDDMVSLPQFLAKYESQESGSTDEEDEALTPTEETYEPSIGGELLEQRRQQEEDEHTSALLSQRAEEILANAKKRLNLMEGNLRGARDLVAPLTTANLKRATSVGSSYVTPTKTYASRNRAIYDRPHYERTNTRQNRLSVQASAPHLAEDYHQGHSRGFSETEILDRPYTALENTTSPVLSNGRLPPSSSDPNWNNALRGSRSYDSLGVLRRRTSRVQGSPESNLEPLVEDDGQYHAVSTPMDRRGSGEDGIGVQQSPSRTEDLREQMSSLKGRISSLRERAKEDSLRRQSMVNLREPSPLNNATSYSPELFYTSSPTYGRPALDTNAGVGWTSQNNSPNMAQAVGQTWSPDPVVTSSRNAFAEQERMMQQQGGDERRRGSRESITNSLLKHRRPSADHQNQAPGGFHKRTPSGTAIVQASKHRYSHHQSQRSIELAKGVKHDPTIGIAADAPTPIRDDQSEAGDSVYEDAESEPSPPVVAHEDREDAFDYENYFLLSAAKAYGRRESTSSDASTTSTATARGPVAAGADNEDQQLEDGDEDFEHNLDMYPPPSPETPEKLRQIERNLHKRTLSTESTSTIATFATATEGWHSPDNADWPIVATSTTLSRPATAIRLNHPSSKLGSDSSSERADSGVGGLPRRSHSSQDLKRPAPRALNGFSPTSPPVVSPPMSPRTPEDPAIVAVNALLGLGSGGKPLGLKDKALLFGVVESLGRLVKGLQDGEAACDSPTLRAKLEGAKKVLEGGYR